MCISTGSNSSCKENQAFRSIKSIKIGLPKGRMIAYIYYTYSTQQTCQLLNYQFLTKIATFVDDICILAVGASATDCIRNLQVSLEEIVAWTAKWNIKRK